MSESTQPLAGKVALGAGASSGIGEATAVALAEAGAAVAIGARRRDRLDALAGKLRNGGARVLQLDLDVTDERACTDAVGRTRAELGGLDVLVNNAGVMLLGTIVGADTEDWRRMISTNVLRGDVHDRGGRRGHGGAGLRRHRQRLQRRRPRRPQGIRRLQRQQVGGERLQRGAAPGGHVPGRPGLPHRARRRRHRAADPHHAAAGPRGLQPVCRGDPPTAGRGHRPGDPLRRDATATRGDQRGPGPAHRPGAVSSPRAISARGPHRKAIGVRAVSVDSPVTTPLHPAGGGPVVGPPPGAAEGAGSIPTPDQRLRVFISSTLMELAEERLAVRDAVVQLRLIPVMFELSARTHPPRDLYRAYLAQSDVFVGIYGESYGWVPPGMAVSGLEDEYELSAGMPRLLYVRRSAAAREPRLQQLIDRMQGEGDVSTTFYDGPAQLG